MSNSITFSGSVLVSSGPGYPFSTKMDITGYDVVQVSIPVSTAATPTTTVNLGPTTATDLVLMIFSDSYSTSLTFDTTTATPITGITLEMPFILTGTSVAKLLGTNTQLNFKNTTTKSVTITILTGR